MHSNNEVREENESTLAPRLISIGKETGANRRGLQSMKGKVCTKGNSFCKVGSTVGGGRLAPQVRRGRARHASSSRHVPCLRAQQSVCLIGWPQKSTPQARQRPCITLSLTMCGYPRARRSTGQSCLHCLLNVINMHQTVVGAAGAPPKPTLLPAHDAWTAKCASC